MAPLSFSPPVLAVEASTTIGSVALWRDQRLIGAEQVTMGAGQADRLFPAVQHLLSTAGIAPRSLEAVVCGAGPGSFTSLRIAAALVKGLAHGAGCPLYAVPSLLVAAAAAKVPPGRYLVHADALRHERYVLPVSRDADGRCDMAGPLARLPLDELHRAVGPAERLAVGTSPFADEIHTVEPTMAALPLAVGHWRSAPVSLEAWEPEYGRLAEAQVKWEAQHGMALPETPAVRA